MQQQTDSDSQALASAATLQENMTVSTSNIYDNYITTNTITCIIETSSTADENQSMDESAYSINSDDADITLESSMLSQNLLTMKQVLRSIVNISSTCDAIVII